MKKLYELSSKPSFWFAGAAYLLSMELIALYYQYGLGFEPCAICVTIRAIVAGGLIASLISGLLLTNNYFSRIGALAINTGFMGYGLSESWYAYKVEAGIMFSTCGFGSPFPSWMPLDSWWPSMFEPKGLCGTSPELMFGITMSEGLLASFAIPLVILSAMLVTTVWVGFTKGFK